MAEKNSKPMYCWMISHPDHCVVPVVAENYEQATIKAARFWGVPWTKVAADMDLERKWESRAHICPKCRHYNAYYEKEYCPACESQLRAEEEAIRHRKAMYFRKQAMKRKAGTA